MLKGNYKVDKMNDEIVGNILFYIENKDLANKIEKEILKISEAKV